MLQGCEQKLLMRPQLLRIRASVTFQELTIYREVGKGRYQRPAAIDFGREHDPYIVEQYWLMRRVPPKSCSSAYNAKCWIYARGRQPT